MQAQRVDAHMTALMAHLREHRRWLPPYVLGKALRLLGRSNPAWTLHFTTTLTVREFADKAGSLGHGRRLLHCRGFDSNKALSGSL